MCRLEFTFLQGDLTVSCALMQHFRVHSFNPLKFNNTLELYCTSAHVSIGSKVQFPISSQVELQPWLLPKRESKHSSWQAHKISWESTLIYDLNHSWLLWFIETTTGHSHCGRRRLLALLTFDSWPFIRLWSDGELITSQFGNRPHLTALLIVVKWACT